MASATNLGKQVEALFRSYVEAGRREVEAALVRAQARTPSTPRSSGSTSEKKNAVGPRRSRASMAQLVEQIIAIVQSQPGCSMKDISHELATASGQLAAPMSIVRKSGRIRSVGARSQMRYFPAVSRSDGRK